MTFIPQDQELKCFAPCALQKVQAGLCRCYNHANSKVKPLSPTVKSIDDYGIKEDLRKRGEKKALQLIKALENVQERRWDFTKELIGKVKELSKNPTEINLTKTAMMIVNQLYDLAEVPVDKRQSINDIATNYVESVLKDLMK